MSYLNTVRKTKEWLKQNPRQTDDRGTTTAQDAPAGRIIAVLIDSPIVGLLWFAFDDAFKSGDDVPIFFVSELPFLRTMSDDELRLRYSEKRALRGGWIRDRIEGSTKH